MYICGIACKCGISVNTIRSVVRHSRLKSEYKCNTDSIINVLTLAILSRVKGFVLYGWKHCSDPELLIFFRRKAKLSVDQNCLLWVSREVVPNKLQSPVLQMLHDQHPGITRSYWLVDTSSGRV